MVWPCALVLVAARVLYEWCMKICGDVWQKSEHDYKPKQMDLHVRFRQNTEVPSRYFGSQFMVPSQLEGILDVVKQAIRDLNLRNLVSVLMDGPNVNFKFLNPLQEQAKEFGGQQLLIAHVAQCFQIRDESVGNGKGFKGAAHAFPWHTSAKGRLLWCHIIWPLSRTFLWTSLGGKSGSCWEGNRRTAQCLPVCGYGLQSIPNPGTASYDPEG